MRTTAAHFEAFRNYCAHFVNEWGLNDWDVRYTHKPDRGNLATCLVDADARIATLNMSRSWEKAAPDAMDGIIRDIAMHEVAHLAMGDLLCAASKRFVSADEADKAAEIAANRICYIVKRMEAVCQNGQGSPTSSS